MDEKKTPVNPKLTPKHSIDRDRHYLPSRFQVEKYQPKSVKTFFQELEELGKSSLVRSRVLQPLSKEEIRNRPLKRQERDYEKFKQIFVQPKQNILNRIKTKPSHTSFLQSLHNTSSTQDVVDIHEAIREAADVSDNMDNANTFTQRGIYQQQMKVDPPQLPNSSIASPLTPGNGYAPSIPPVQLIKENKSYMNDLLLRCQNGGHSEDIEKESHLSFFLGLTYEKRGEHQLATKFFKKFAGFAKLMNDKIGMALGANRIGYNEFYSQNFQKSLMFHEENLRLSDSDNSFAGFYNLGIVSRRLGKNAQALDFFESALEWALDRNSPEEVPLVYGQLGTTYLVTHNYQQALTSFEKCLELCESSNPKLYLDTLLTITNLSIHHNVQSSMGAQELIETSLQVSNELNLLGITEVCLCNLGIIKAQKILSLTRAPAVDQIEVIS